MTTTKQKPIDAFYARLEPELTNADLERRSVNAVRLCLEALEKGDTALAVRAFDRLLERWDQRDQRQPALARWMWVKRHAAVEAIEAAAPEGWGRLPALWHQYYCTMGRIDGMSAEAADDYAYERAQRMVG